MNRLHTLLGASALTLSLGLFATLPSYAAGSSVTQTLATEWAHTVYEQPTNSHKKRLELLYDQAREAVLSQSEDAELLTWSGIIAATYAGAKGGFGALKVAKQARRDLERAMALDPEALNGGARSSLGTLYSKVPGWPIGFGNKKKAGKLLTESALKYPENLSAQFFYAEYLISTEQREEAHRVLQAAAAIPIGDETRVADTGRMQQVKELLLKLEISNS